MKKVKCSDCGEVFRVEEDEVEVECPACEALIDLPLPRRSKGTTGREVARKSGGRSRPVQKRKRKMSWYAWLWVFLASAAGISAILVLLGVIEYKLHHGAVFFGVILFVIACILSRLTYHIDSGNWHFLPTAELLVNFVANFFRHPQLGLMVLLSVGTLILGAILGDPARGRGEKQEADNTPEASFTTAKTPPPATVLPGLTAYWSFDEGDGDLAGDASPNGIQGTVHGAQWVDGIRGKALQFNGTSDYLDLDTSPLLNVGEKFPFSITSWVKTTEANGPILSFSNDQDQYLVFKIRVLDKKLQFAIREDRSIFSPHEATNPTIVINDNEWHHFAVTRDANGKMQLYVDGTSKGSKKDIFDHTADGSVTSNVRYLGRELERKRGAITGSQYFKGSLDEVCFFSHTLSPEEIASLAGRD